MPNPVGDPPVPDGMGHDWQAIASMEEWLDDAAGETMHPDDLAELLRRRGYPAGTIEGVVES